MVIIDSIEQKLEALAHLQMIDSELDRIRLVRGSLPEEVKDLEDELEGLNTRINNFNAEIDQAKSEIADHNENIRTQRESQKKYEQQLNNVKNSREFEALQKEIEMASLEILASERRIKIRQDAIRQIEEKAAEVKKNYEERLRDLNEKKSELDSIVAETEKEEQMLQFQSQTAASAIEPRLLNAYRKIRKNMRNGLAVVTMDRNACGGCFAVIPPQRQYEIRQRKKLIVCENCGRILVDQGIIEKVHGQENVQA